MSDFPKYQYSIFPGGDKDEQFVIRSNDFGELKKLKKNIDTIIKTGKKKQSGDPEPELTRYCKQCETEMEYKSGYTDGKKWEGYFCPKNRDHDPFWIPRGKK